MRLRNLTIKGFKSFAKETSLNFNEDVIGVVGPNGSGKSNVVDAIRWVLGEQRSSDLRLEKMSDVLFNGTKKKKEASAAQVTLTFDNDKGILPSEYSEVSISRLLYRSGESEYRLNDVRCRLKDINTLLMDTGMGSNSYAIIALGMVDDILSDKDHARRQMFEQAAGISKYKQRKKETKSKLKSTQRDLDRIEDLIFEIDGNLKSLEKQARRARKYLEIKDQYREESIKLATFKIHKLRDDYKEIEKDLATEIKAYNDLDASMLKKEAEVEALKNNTLDSEQALSQTQQALNKLVNTIRKLETDRGLLNQKSDFKQQSHTSIWRGVENNKKVVVELSEKLINQQERIQSEQEQVDAMNTELSAMKSDLASIRSQHETVKSQTDQHNRDVMSKRETIYELEKKIALLQNNITNISESFRRSEQNYHERTQEKTKHKDQAIALQKDVAIAQEELAQLSKSNDERKQQLDNLYEKRSQYKNELSGISRKLDATRNEFNLLKSMVDSMEGYPESIKYLSKTLESPLPILSDLLDVDDAYKTVIETYLSPYLNHYVVDHQDTALHAIDLLSKSQKGRAQFFIMDLIKSTHEDLPPYQGLDHVKNFISVAPEYQKLLDLLLKNTFVTDENNFQKFTDEHINLITINGRVIRQGSTLSGGSIGLFEGKKIGRKKTLEKLESKIQKLDNSRVDLEKDISNTEFRIEQLKKQDFERDIKTKRRSVEQLERELYKIDLKLQAYKDLKKERQAKEAEYEEKSEALTKELHGYEDAIKITKGELQEIEKSSVGQNNQLEVFAQALSDATSSYNTRNIEVIKRQNLVENLQRDLDYDQKRLKDIKEDIRRGEIRIRDAHKEIEELRTRIADIGTQLQTLYTEKESEEGALNQAEQEYYASRKIITDGENEVKKLSRSMNQIQLKVQKLRDSLTDVKFNISSVAERIKIEFEININDLINEAAIEEAIDEEELSKKLEKLRIKLGNYGEVNPMAVEAYNEMQERHEDIIKQRNDILEAKEILEKTITEIESKATTQYLASFNQVRSNFIEVFRSLFSEEDDCDLVLLDATNPIDSDIDIIAKPKGKKPKSLSQLSGGEKTLTATALLFALYLLKPAPFCIFDEVDAPLDDANIAKFNKIIKKFSNESQFIIVTHNKATMAAVDVLYGVHMQEQGVSSVTPVDFRSFGNSHEFIANS